MACRFCGGPRGGGSWGEQTGGTEDLGTWPPDQLTCTTCSSTAANSSADAGPLILQALFAKSRAQIPSTALKRSIMTLTSS